MSPWLLAVSAAIYAFAAGEWAWRGDWPQFFMFAGYAVAGVAVCFISYRSL